MMEQRRMSEERAGEQRKWEVFQDGSDTCCDRWLEMVVLTKKKTAVRAGGGRDDDSKSLLLGVTKQR